MKECSKCKCQLDESRFVKSPRYLDGLYPSCKSCRKIARDKTLADHPMCARCKVVPHLGYIPYCVECFRISKGRPVVPLRIRDANNKEWCSRCRQMPRLEYHNYCYFCKNTAHAKWEAAHNKKPKPTEKHRKYIARRYINGLFRRGKIKRKPCELCGRPSQHFHHLDYEDRTVNVQHLCFSCHVQAERTKRNLTN